MSTELILNRHVEHLYLIYYLKNLERIGDIKSEAVNGMKDIKERSPSVGVGHCFVENVRVMW